MKNLKEVLQVVVDIAGILAFVLAVWVYFETKTNEQEINKSAKTMQTIESRVSALEVPDSKGCTGTAIEFERLIQNEGQHKVMTGIASIDISRTRKFNGCAYIKINGVSDTRKYVEDNNLSINILAIDLSAGEGFTTYEVGEIKRWINKTTIEFSGKVSSPVLLAVAVYNNGFGFGEYDRPETFFSNIKKTTRNLTEQTIALSALSHGKGRSENDTMAMLLKKIN